MNKLSHIFMFSLGAAVGSVVAWKLLKTTYEQRAQEEIESIKAHFTVPKTNEPANEDNNEPVDNGILNKKIVEKELSVKEYASLLTEQGYTDYSGQKNTVHGAYVIKPEEFGEMEDYDRVSLSYYADQILVDDTTDEIIENIEAAVGTESLRHFGEYEPDIVHVRNDILGCDYEISLDARKYSDLYSHKMEE